MTQELKAFDDRKILPRRTRQDASKIFLTDLIYQVPVADTMKMIIPFYWNAGKKILDVTAGQRLIWLKFLYNHRSPCGFEHWHIDFNDIDKKNKKADIHMLAQEINKLKKHYDILVCDFPFTELKNGVESFGVRTKRAYTKNRQMNKQKFRRQFYFQYFVPPEINFADSVFAFNKVADNLVIKMGDAHKNKVLIPNHIFAALNFDKRFNPRSEFYLIDIIKYRGIYSSRGGRFPFAQSVTSYYLIFKKNPDSR